MELEQIVIKDYRLCPVRIIRPNYEPCRINSDMVWYSCYY